MDELSSAVSRVNIAPWEDPFALSLGQAAPIAEEGKYTWNATFPGFVNGASLICLEPAGTSTAGPAKASDPGSSGLEERHGDDDSFVEVDDGKDDKMRRIAKALEAGDVVEEAHVSCDHAVSKYDELIDRTSFG